MQVAGDVVHVIRAGELQEREREIEREKERERERGEGGSEIYSMLYSPSNID